MKHHQTPFYYLLLFIAVISNLQCRATAFAPPVGSIGAIFFKPRVTICKSEDEESLVDAGKFFVEAFWTGKIGGAERLSPSQSSSLDRQQIAEFKKRYKRPARRGEKGTFPGLYSSNKRSELVLCLDAQNKNCIVGCAGIEVETIKKLDGYDGTFDAPLMSNLAIGRRYRRKGLAEDLVASVEAIARKEWGYDECYLYVEKRNAPAVKLYKKLGYRVLWEDDTATTLLPTEDGKVKNGQTTIVCMKKKIGGGLFGFF